MDVALERILSLLPRKENGDFVHGAKKELAENIGFKGGTIVNDWIAGRSQTYRNYLYEIADKYNVSVAWLKGETDDPRPKATRLGLDFGSSYSSLAGDGLSADDAELVELFRKASPEIKRAALAVLRAADDGK